MHAQLASEARLLEAAKADGCIHEPVGVDPYQAGFKFARERMRLFYVAGPNGGSQAVRAGVGLRGDLLHIVEADGGQYRPENFFLRDGHLVFHAIEDGGLHEKSLCAVDRSAVAAGHKLRAFFFSGLDVAQNLVHLLLADDGAAPPLGSERIARAELTGALPALSADSI